MRVFVILVAMDKEEKRTEVLYRKYRPQNFNEVFGQDHVIKVLEASLKSQNLGHAYIFSGPRGTGKTSVARIFARSLGCADEDIIEMDAASNRGIDEIRNLKESVLSLPFRSPYKMYILDEAHMLTNQAFNALLKTLEEPPTHVIFVLATTELHKIPDTVISRCQVFSFHSPTREILKEMIKAIAEKEGYQLDEESLEMIAFLGNGSFRDTQGVLQKLFSYAKDKKLSYQEVIQITGAPSNKILLNFLSAIQKKDMASILRELRNASKQNIDPQLFLSLLVEKIRLILQIRFASELREEIKKNIGESAFQDLIPFIEEGKIFHSKLLKRLLEIYQDMQYLSLPYLAIELAFYELFEDSKE